VVATAPTGNAQPLPAVKHQARQPHDIDFSIIWTPRQQLLPFVCGIVPGLAGEPDADGFYTYTRPEGKSGGHGVGWSEVPRYSFRVPPGWEETPVSIADLGGTEVGVLPG